MIYRNIKMGTYLMYKGNLVKLRAYKETDIERLVEFINDEEVMNYVEMESTMIIFLWHYLKKLG